ncbi:malonyl-coenzyme:anthocyanin 5-O-glucoside-6'''-O-malonyltransferase-like [Macadamia integrifolia]|uniref:malonyl-coenzyme:anthocyanin 5-O-glucoside-6'''-O-malonyltransferase-like n=1 Tax=Macadamia integrifolia TaxID=60698 RepID=UPI001C52B17F|nr:malonyl-coenzyme:anthocyanin 5-O-glucoside-6'''-O-malonyltransferase-like [Macadamia integrifolia]
MICYTEGDTVTFTVAESDADFYHLSSNHLKDAKESRPLVPHLSTFGTTVPMLAIQVTVFPNTRIYIGLSHHHTSCDGRGFTHFMRTWASISKLGAGFGSLSSDQSLPILDRTVIKEQDDMLKMFLDKLDGFMGSESVSGNRILSVMDVELQPNMVRATLQLMKQVVRNSRNGCSLDEKTQTRSINPPSRLVAICAYTWICLLKAEAKVGGSNTNNMTLFVLTVDCRARLDPPVPEAYLGNCMRPYVVVTNKSDLMRGGIGLAAQLIGDEVHEMHKGILRGMGRMAHSVSGLIDMPPNRVLVGAGSPRFGYYKTDFGFGRPKKVETTSIDRT